MAVKKGLSLCGASLFGAKTENFKGGGRCFDLDEDCERGLNSKRARCLR